MKPSYNKNNTKKQSNASSPNKSKQMLQRKKAPSQGPVKVVLNSFNFSFEKPFIVSVWDVQFNSKILENIKDKDFLVTQKKQLLQSYFQKQWFVFDNANIVITAHDVSIKNTHDLEFGPVFPSILFEDLMKKSQSEQYLSLCNRSEGNICFGSRLVGSVLNDKVILKDKKDASSFDWIRFVGTHLFCKTLTIDARDEMITIGKEVSVMDYLRKRNVNLKNEKEVLHELVCFKLVVKMNKSNKRTITRVKGIVHEKNCKSDVDVR